MTDTAISDYGLLSDCQSAALVNREGSIDWLCLPRFDSPSIFARLLGPDAGHWSIAPAMPFESSRTYLDRSLVLETTFRTASGVAVLTDALLFDRRERGHDIGMNAPHILVRQIAVTDGEVELAAVFRPRPEYGIVTPRLMHRDGMLLSRGGADLLWLSGPVPDDLDEGTAKWNLRLHAGASVYFTLGHGRRWTTEPNRWSPRDASRGLKETIKGWQSWSKLHQNYEGPARDLVHHSGRVLRALTYEPTGAVVAAATMSLPEQVGGERNWDYRYSWIRDASFTLNALWIAACPEESGRFLHWIIETAGTAMSQEQGLQIMYGVGGEHDLSERVLPHLTGWKNSRPVRVGNGAWSQTQVDIFGELLDAVLTHRARLGEASADMQRFLIGVAECAARAWTEPDAGIWEIRGEPRHHVYSKLMCWVAMDRAIRLADWLGAQEMVPAWDEVRAEIRSAILERSWNEDVGAFTQCFEDDQLDTSALMMVITGFLPATDPRMSSTIDRIREQLSGPGGLLYRYSSDDGLTGGEGAFLLCSFWLVECLAARGDGREATELFERVAGCANDLGLLSEEVDPTTGTLLGNFPQAFSHVGLVNAAQALLDWGQRTQDQKEPR